MRYQKEADYNIKAAEWRLLDPANPAFLPVGYEKKGKNLQSDYKINPDETAEDYWDGVRKDLHRKREN